jgi:hypothetical protein
VLGTSARSEKGWRRSRRSQDARSLESQTSFNVPL